MAISIETNDGICRLRVEDEMTIYNAVEFKQALLANLSACGEMEINLSGVGEMDTAGLQMLLLAKREAAVYGKKLRLVEHSPATLEVLDLYNMAGYFGDPVVMPSSKPQAAA